MKSNRVLVSVALATYNGAQYIEKQLDSVLNQTYPVDEIIIVDDCSSDNTVDIIKSYQKCNSKIKLFINEKNLRSNLSFNKAISLTSGDLIAFCDQDDIWDKNKIEDQVTELSKHDIDNDKPLLIYHDLRLMSNEEAIINDSFWKLHNFTVNSISYHNLLYQNYITGCTCMINTSMRSEMLKCDMEGIIMYDHLLALLGYGLGQVLPINKALISYREHNSSVTVKNRVPLRKRFFNVFINCFSSEYMKKYIVQAEKIFAVYQDYLDSRTQRITLDFVSLKNKSSLSQFFSVQWKKMKIR